MAAPLPESVLFGAGLEIETKGAALGLLAVMVRIRVADVEVPAELLAFTLTFDVPATDGVPEMRPVTLLKESPVGSPVALKLVGELVAVIWNENAVPTLPDAVKALVRTGVKLPPLDPAEVIVMMRVSDVEVPAELLAYTLTCDVPAAVGVPEMRPVALLKESPAGSPVAPKLVGELVAVIWKENGDPTAPDAVKALVRTGVKLPPLDPAEVIVMMSVADVEVPAALEAFTLTFDVPAAVGVPEIRPVALLKESPAGSPVALKLVGELVAVIWKENGVPTLPDAAKAMGRMGTAVTAGACTETVVCIVTEPAPLVAVRV